MSVQEGTGMKKSKKLFMMLLVCLLMSMSVMPISASAAKLNKKSITLNVGKTYTLKTAGIKGKITWSSSKKRNCGCHCKIWQEETYLQS